MKTMKSSRELRETIAAKQVEAEAILDQAEEEGRELSKQEQAAFDAICGRGKEGERNYIAGEIGELKVELGRSERREEIETNKRQAASIHARYIAGEFDEEMRRNAELHGVGNVGFHSGTSTRGWQTNGEGKKFAMLNKGERLADFSRTPCDDAFGHYALAAVFGAGKATPSPIKNALSEGVGSAGGFTVPSEMMTEVIDLARAKSVLMEAGTRTVVMGSESMTVPTLVSDQEVELKGENERITFSDVKIGSRMLVTRTAASITAISRELWEDSPNLLAANLSMWMSAKMAEQIDRIGLQGYVSKPAGLLDATGVNKTGSIGAIDWLDVSQAASRIRVNNHEPNTVIMHPTIYDDLLTIEAGDGSTSARSWLNAPPTLAGKTFLHSTNCPLAKMVCGDFSRYLMGVRNGITLETSAQAGESFERHQVYLKAFSRFDFVVLDDTAFEVLEDITS